MNNNDISTRVQQDPNFIALVRKKTRLGWTLSAFMLVVYYGFILVLAFAPELLGTKIGDGPVTVGIPVGLGIILTAFVLTGIYVYRANTDLDELNRRVVEAAK